MAARPDAMCRSCGIVRRNSDPPSPWNCGGNIGEPHNFHVCAYSLF